MATKSKKSAPVDVAPAPLGKVPAVSSDIFGSVLTLNFSNGKELSIDLEKLSPEMKRMAGVHGLKQKLVDAAAIPRDTVTGLEASIDDKYAAVKTVFDRIQSDTPTWNSIREGGTAAVGGVFLRAMCELTGQSADNMRVALEQKTKEETAALRKNPKVIQKMADIQLADIAAKNGTADNSDDLLEGLMA